MGADLGYHRDSYAYWLALPTRWSDNDMLGHVNNVLYFHFMEAVIVDFLIREGDLDWLRDPAVPYAVDIRCHMRRPLSFPQTVDAGLRIDRLGTSSVTYGIGLFAAGAPDAAALGAFVHVYVDRTTEQPVPIPPPIRAVYERFAGSPATLGRGPAAVRT
jgi:acyl-CoA thioester hydrolase